MRQCSHLTMTIPYAAFSAVGFCSITARRRTVRRHS